LVFIAGVAIATSIVFALVPLVTVDLVYPALRFRKRRRARHQG
jgi:hypothetical protein